MRIAMRALLGLDPDDGHKGELAAEHFERALSYYGTEYPLRFLRGPRTPWRKLHASRAVLDEIVYAEIARRRGETGSGRGDVLSMLLEATDEDGARLSDREVRDQAMTLMFAGHDTSTSTISFMLYELARHPHALEALAAEQDRVLAGRRRPRPSSTAALPELDMALDETLRLYPAAWIGPRRASRSSSSRGATFPRGRT